MYTPKPGTYKSLLQEGFKNIEREDVAELFGQGKCKLGIVATFAGNVVTLPTFTEPCIKALESLEPSDDANYYIEALRAERVKPCSTAGAYVYHLMSGAPIPEDNIQERNGAEEINYFNN